MGLEAGDQAVDLRLRRHAAGRVGRAVQDDQARCRGDARQHGLGGETESLRLGQRDGHRLGAAVVDQRAVDGKARIGVEDLRARFAEHEHGEEHGDLAAGHDDDTAGIDLDSEPLVEVGGDRPAQGGDAVGRRVAVVAVAQRLDARLDDMRRGLEIRLPDTEINDTAPAGLELRCARQHRKGGFRAQAADGSGGLQHGTGSWRGRAAGKVARAA
jgi:hypothetical protein